MAGVADVVDHANVGGGVGDVFVALLVYCADS